MSKVRGKDPLTVQRYSELFVNSFNQTITVHMDGHDGTSSFKVKGTLSIYCVGALILELRKGLRKIRDENIKKLNRLVEESEASL